MNEPLRAPFPYFGGKSRAAAIIWDALGDPGGYVEPFAGSAAVLLARPPSGRRVETLNDADGWIVNTWRAIRHAPDQVAAEVVGPVSEIDLHARAAWLKERATPDLVSWLEGDPEHYDVKAAAWWVYVACTTIGEATRGPWVVEGGRLVNRPGSDGISRRLPHLGDAGRGVFSGSYSAPGAVQTLMRRLAARLQHVRITAGDWTRVLTPSVLRATSGNQQIGVFLDPPYTTSPDLYSATSHSAVSEDVRAWCKQADPALRIVLAGYLDDHDELLNHGWHKTVGAAGGSGMTKDLRTTNRERLWMSPACESPDLFSQLGEVVA